MGVTALTLSLPITASYVIDTVELTVTSLTMRAPPSW